MNAHTVYSYGYHGRQVEELDSLAERLNAVIVDTRYSPRSRDPRWGRAALERMFGSRYCWVREFGNLLYTTDAVQLNDPEGGIERVRPLICDRPILLLCMCPKADRCHRADVAALIAERFGVAVQHLGGSGLGKIDRQADLFAQPDDRTVEAER